MNNIELENIQDVWINRRRLAAKEFKDSIQREFNRIFSFCIHGIKKSEKCPICESYRNV